MIKRILKIVKQSDFDSMALELFNLHFNNNPVYNSYVSNLGINTKTVQKTSDIPHLPVSFFKTKKIALKNLSYNMYFESSGTTSVDKSKHYISDIEIYKKTLTENFKFFFGNTDE